MKLMGNLLSVGCLTLFLVTAVSAKGEAKSPLAAASVNPLQTPQVSAGSGKNSGAFAVNPVASENLGEFAEVFDPKNNTWLPAGSKATKREAHAAVELEDGDIFVLRDAVRANGAEIFSIVNNSWRLAADPLFPVNAPVGIRLRDGRVLVLGQETTRLGLSELNRNRAQIFDPKQNSWSLTRPAKLERREPGAVILESGEVLIVGGYISGFQKSESTELYLSGSNLWQDGASLKVPRDQVKLVLISDGRVLAVGGTSDPRTEIFDPKGRSWRANAPVSMQRIRMHSLTRLKDGKVLLIGGIGQDDRPVKAVEKFDPATGQWKPAASAPVSLYMHSAVQLDDGKVLVAGGYHDEKADASVLIYDPETNKWSTNGRMRGWESYRTFTKLKDGRVLAVGGNYPFNPQPQIASETKPPFPQDKGIRLVEALSECGSGETYLIAPGIVDEEGKQVIIHTLNFLYSAKDISPVFSSQSSTGVTVEPKEMEDKLKNSLHQRVLGQDLVSAVSELVEARKALYKKAVHLSATGQEFFETPEYRRHLKADRKLDAMLIKKFNLAKVGSGADCD